jgi:putative chitinase
MNLESFYNTLRKYFTLTSENVRGFDFILKEPEARKILLPHLAYILATVWHETASRMQPIAEYGKGKGHKYGVPGKYKQAPYGRGYVQLTWDANYEKADRELLLKGKLLNDFDLALNPIYAVQILFLGMEEGWFTGKKISDFIDTIDEPDSEDEKEYEEGRKVINGVDKKVLIAGYAIHFEKALKDGGYGLKDTQTVVQPIPDNPGVPQSAHPTASTTPSKGILEMVIGILSIIFGVKQK